MTCVLLNLLPTRDSCCAVPVRLFKGLGAIGFRDDLAVMTGNTESN